jgi:hypothetical protein
METLELLAKNEEQVSELYKLYARVLPQYKELWLELADEEINHAAWIRDFTKDIDSGKLILNKKRFPVEAFNTYYEYLKESIKRADERGIEPVEAFTVALYIEKSLIELKFFEAVVSSCKSFNEIALRLSEATKGHFKKIEEYWSKVKDKTV